MSCPLWFQWCKRWAQGQADQSAHASWDARVRLYPTRCHHSEHLSRSGQHGTLYSCPRSLSSIHPSPVCNKSLPSNPSPRQSRRRCLRPWRGRACPWASMASSPGCLRVFPSIPRKPRFQLESCKTIHWPIFRPQSPRIVRLGRPAWTRFSQDHFASALWQNAQPPCFHSSLCQQCLLSFCLRNGTT